jgi:carbon monoxide dehydrogenase subunit G
MQMSGQETIAASRQRVWDTLYDPEVLKRCIPGCQSLTQETEDRLRVIAEIKIGPIGARFNAVVTRTDIDAPRSCAMRIEGQGGTVGFVKSGAKLRLSDAANGGTVLTYEVDAEVGGRLAQLGGPILDATAKQLSAKFFRQLGAAIGAPPTAAAATTLPVTAGAAATAARSPSPWWTALAVCIAALIGYLLGNAQSAGGAADWRGLALGLLVIVVAAAGFELGRRSAAPVLQVDPALLTRLLALLQKQESER